MDKRIIFQEKVDKKFGKEKYTILGNYINNKTKIKIRCNVCGYEWDIEKILGKEEIDSNSDNKEIVVATYARCSTADQKAHGDIDRQSARIFEYCTKHKYKVEYIIKDMGSGLNDKRKGFTKLCSLVVNGKINKVVIEHKDRLTRFQYNLIEFFFNSYGVEIELLDKKEYTEQEELVNDMMMLIASFSGKIYSLRAQENRKKQKSKESNE